MISKVKSVTMEIPEDIIEIQKRYAKAVAKIIMNRLSSEEVDEFIKIASNEK